MSSPAAQPRSVKSGVVRIVLFFVLLTGVLFLLDAVINTGLRRLTTGTYGVTNRIVQGRVNAEILISGSSRAQTHYDPQIIQSITGRSTFNMGINGSQTDMQLAMLKTYLQHNPKPALVIHNLDLFSFVTTHEVYDPAQYLPYLHETPLYEGIRQYQPGVWKWRYLPLYGYAVEDLRFTWLLGLKGFAGVQPPETHFQGYTPRHTPWTGEFEAFRANHPEGVTFEIEERGVRLMEELVQVCVKNGIPLILVYSPVYSEMQPLERNRDEIFRRFHALADTFKVPIEDFSSSMICRDQANFYNSQHLNVQGATLFSQELAARLKAKGFTGRL
ncbi:MAG: hypothetical protein V4675_07585 [Verrucomicrobiota bacterium]